jgi:hypothetical protein
VIDPNDRAFEPLIWKQMPLTKREYFAAAALQGILAHLEIGNPKYSYTLVAIEAVQFADALIKELNKEEK